MGMPDPIADRKRKQRVWQIAGFCCLSCRRVEKSRYRRRPRCDRGKNPRRTK